MHNDTLTFDSDVLELLTIDWEDVRQVVTDNTQTVRTEGRDRFSGALRVDEHQVRVIDAEGVTNAFDRRLLLGMVEGAPRELNYWSFKLGAGITFQSGNTKQSDLSVNARIRRRTAGNRLNLE